MLELVFVITILGLLASIALPRFAATRDDAIVVKYRAQVAAIRSGIALQKSRRILESEPGGIYPPALDSGGTRLFNYGDGNTSNILETPYFVDASRKDGWTKAGNTYTLKLGALGSVDFTYNSATGSFSCNRAIANCKKLID